MDKLHKLIALISIISLVPCLGVIIYNLFEEGIDNE